MKTLLFPIRLGQLAKLVGGKLVRGQPRTSIQHVVYGSTKYLKSGVVLFLKSSQSLPYRLQELKSKQSAGVVTSSNMAHLIPRHHPLILVSSPDHAIWKLTSWQRNQSKALFIGITGSAGKTSTKEMTASILSQKYRVMKSYANNNIFACIPGNFMRLSPIHQVAVLEMGMASLGNIRKQCLYARPSIGVITNVGEAHVGSLGNSLNNVVRAKQELINGLRPGGTLILNADDPGSKRLKTKGFRGKIITFGINQPATIRGQKIRFCQDGMRFEVEGSTYHIPTWGKHNVYNALASIAVGKQLGIAVTNIQKGLRTFPVPYMRLQPLKGVNGYTLINDAYNANPTSMIAGLQVLKQVAKHRYSVAVLGDMNELGTWSSSGHRKVGAVVARLKPSRLITVGTQAATIAHSAITHGFPSRSVKSFSRLAPVSAYIRKTVSPGSVIYFKASRKLTLEKAVKSLRIS